MKAQNSLGISYSDDITFTTLGGSPQVVSVNAADIFTSSATLNGTVNPNYLLSTVTFEYGLTTDYGSDATPFQNSFSGESNVGITVAVTELNPGKIYHFRIKAENSLGITYSDDMTFATLGAFLK